MNEDLKDIFENLIDQELELMNTGKFNKDRCMLIHNLAGFWYPKQSTTTAMPGSSDTETISVEYVD